MSPALSVFVLLLHQCKFPRCGTINVLSHLKLFTGTFKLRTWCKHFFRTETKGFAVKRPTCEQIVWLIFSSSFTHPGSVHVLPWCTATDSAQTAPSDSNCTICWDKLTQLNLNLSVPVSMAVGLSELLFDQGPVCFCLWRRRLCKHQHNQTI